MLLVVDMMTPFAPFLAETLYQKLKTEEDMISVHLHILEDVGPIDENLLQKMHDAQRVVYLARNLREKVKVKTRQPLARLLIATLDTQLKNDIVSMNDIILDELNIKVIEFIANDSEIVKKSAKPNFKSIGPRFGKAASLIAARIKEFSEEEVDVFEEHGSITMNVHGDDITLGTDDIEVVHEDIEGWTIGVDGNLVVALDTAITPELENEGIARELVSRIQQMRKDKDYDITDRIIIQYQTLSDRLEEAIKSTLPYIQNETLATDIVRASKLADQATRLNVNEFEIDVELERVSAN
jgi:isoleucyl-tRNA synthetase